MELQKPVTSKELSKLLSAKEVEKICGYPLKATSTANLHKFNDIDDLFYEGSPGALILFQDSHKNNFFSGHFCALLRNPNELVFFDPYGDNIGVQYDFIRKDYRNKTNQTKNDIARLMSRSRYKKLFYNEYQYQKMKKGINTCGRWCGLYLNLRILPDKFKHEMKQLAETIQPKTSDDLSVILTRKFI